MVATKRSVRTAVTPELREPSLKLTWTTVVLRRQPADSLTNSIAMMAAENRDDVTPTQRTLNRDNARKTALVTLSL